MKKKDTFNNLLTFPIFRVKCAFPISASLRGRRLKGKEKGVLEKEVLGARVTRGAREEGGSPPPSSLERGLAP